jgi:hypothetical protein
MRIYNHLFLTIVLTVCHLLTVGSIEFASIDTLNGDAIVVHLQSIVQLYYVRTCDSTGLFCVDDYGSFPISIARILVDSDVSLTN